MTVKSDNLVDSLLLHSASFSWTELFESLQSKVIGKIGNMFTRLPAMQKRKVKKDWLMLSIAINENCKKSKSGIVVETKQERKTEKENN